MPASDPPENATPLPARTEEEFRRPGEAPPKAEIPSSDYIAKLRAETGAPEPREAAVTRRTAPITPPKVAKPQAAKAPQPKPQPRPQPAPLAEPSTGKFLEDTDAATKEIPAAEGWRDRATAAANALNGQSDVEIMDPGEVTETLPGDEIEERVEQEREAMADKRRDSSRRRAPTAELTADSPRILFDRARAAQKTWGALRFEQRWKNLAALRAELVEKRQDYAPALATLLGKPMLETLNTEYLPPLDTLTGLPDHLPPLLVERVFQPLTLTSSGQTVHLGMRPLGAVLVVTGPATPFGLPLTLAIQAIAAGNACVLLVDDGRPRAAEMLQRVIERSDLPAGLLAVRVGNPKRALEMVEGRPDKAFWAHTSVPGRDFQTKCVSLDVPSLALVQSKNILVVTPGANLDKAANAAAWAAFTGGALVNSCERIVVHSSIYDEFKLKFFEQVRSLNSHHAQLTQLRPAIDIKRLTALLQDAVATGARISYPSGETPGKWIHWRAGIIEGLTNNARLSYEPVIAPLCALIRAEDWPLEVRRLHTFASAAACSVLGPVKPEERTELESLRIPTLSLGEPVVGQPAWLGAGAVGDGGVQPWTGLLHMLQPLQVIESSGKRSQHIAWFPYTDDKAQLLMTAISAQHGEGLFARLRLWWGIWISGWMRLLRRGE